MSLEGKPSDEEYEVIGRDQIVRTFAEQYNAFFFPADAGQRSSTGKRVLLAFDHARYNRTKISNIRPGILRAETTHDKTLIGLLAEVFTEERDNSIPELTLQMGPSALKLPKEWHALLSPRILSTLDQQVRITSTIFTLLKDAHINRTVERAQIEFQYLAEPIGELWIGGKSLPPLEERLNPNAERQVNPFLKHLSKAGVDT